MIACSVLRPVSQASLPSITSSSDCPQTCLRNTNQCITILPLSSLLSLSLSLSLKSSASNKRRRMRATKFQRSAAHSPANFPSILPLIHWPKKVRKLRRMLDSKEENEPDFGLPSGEQKTPHDIKAPLPAGALGAFVHFSKICFFFFFFLKISISSHDRFSCAIPPGTSHWLAAATPRPRSRITVSPTCPFFVLRLPFFFVGHPFVSFSLDFERHILVQSSSKLM